MLDRRVSNFTGRGLPEGLVGSGRVASGLRGSRDGDRVPGPLVTTCLKPPWPNPTQRDLERTGAAKGLRQLLSNAAGLHQRERFLGSLNVQKSNENDFLKVR